MSPSEPSHTTTASPDYPNTAETQGNNSKNNFMKIIEIHKEEINKSLKEIYGHRNSGRK